jgi:hypothetical protein
MAIIYPNDWGERAQQESIMIRTLRVLIRRDSSRDRQDGQTCLEGYAFLWPDGRPLGVGFDAFCKQGQRLFGLGQHLRGCLERLVEIIYFPLAGLEDELTRLPGYRVRRFFLHRSDRQGRLHFFNGTPTAIVLDLDRDEQYVLNWIGLTTLRDGESAWFDLAARPAEPEVIAGPTSP